MTKEETWKELVRLGVVAGKMPEGRWDLRGIDLGTAGEAETQYRCHYFPDEANLIGVDLSGANLARVYLPKANLIGALMIEADLRGAYLTGANLAGAYLGGANLVRARLNGANLTGANLTGADLYEADLSEANLTRANLNNTHLVGVNLEMAKLNDCHVYGISAWDLRLQGTEQANLIITPEGQPVITVDNLKLAQFIYLLLNNPEVREIIDTITSKLVLILGRFTPERKAILDALRNKLRQRNYTPVLFDFAGPENRDITETISTLAHMARFVIADITDAKSIPQELMAIVPNLPSVPVQPILQVSSDEYGMFEHFERFPWVLPIYHYSSIDDVIASLSDKIISPAEAYSKK